MTTSDLTTIGNAIRTYKKWCKDNKKVFHKPSFTESTVLTNQCVVLRDSMGLIRVVHGDEVLENRG